MLVLQPVKNREVLKNSENTLKPAHGASNGLNFFLQRAGMLLIKI